MSTQVPTQEQLDMAKQHNGGAVEYGLYIEEYTGKFVNGKVPATTREDDWVATIYPHRDLADAKKRAKEYTVEFPWPTMRNVHVVQRKVSPWEVKEND